MKIELNGRKIVDVGYFMYCENCPLDRDGGCLAYIFRCLNECNTGFKYEDNI